MYIRMKHIYSFIFDNNNNLFIFDASIDDYIFKIHLPEKSIVNLLRKLQQPLCLENETDNDATIIKGLLLKYLAIYFEEIDMDLYVKECRRTDKIQYFQSLYKEGFNLSSDSLFALIRKVLYLSNFIFIGFEKLPMYFDMYNCKVQNTIEDTEFKDYNVYIINFGSISIDSLRKFEDEATKHKITRLYVKESKRYIQIGPAMNGGDFGCFFCELEENKIFAESMELEKNLSSLSMALLETELIKICSDIIENIIMDITISSGKRFVLDKFSMEAYQEEKWINVNCEICGGKK